MLVFCAGMRRAGSTAIFNIVRELVEESKTGYALRLPQHNHVTISGYFNSTQYVIVKGHALKDYFEERINDAKVLMSVRDVRDIMCSLIRLRKTSFDILMEFEVIDGYIKEQQSWNCAKNVYFKRYEDWVDNLFEEAKQIAEFLKIELDDEKILDIAANWSVEKSDERAQKTSGTNHITFLNPGHITSMERVDFREMLTEEQIEIMNKKYGWWLRKYNYAC